MRHSVRRINEKKDEWMSKMIPQEGGREGREVETEVREL